MAGAANAINELTTGICGFTGTAFTGTPVSQYKVQVGGATSSTLAEVGPGSSGQVLQSGGAASNPAYSTATYPSTATGTGTILRADGTNWVASTATYPNTAGTAGKVLISDGTNIVSSTPTFPNASASSGKFIRSDGTNWIASTPTLPTTAGTTGKVLQSDGTNYVESTATYPTSTTANQILYSSSANVIGEITAGTNNSILMGNTGAAPAFTTSGTPYVTGISFDAGTTTLSNYATGTFTPNFSSTSINITYTARVGTYTRIGNIVSISCNTWCNAVTNGGSGTLTITGLPFTARNTTNLNNIFTSWSNFNMGGSNSMISWLNSPNTTTLQLESIVVSTGANTSAHTILANEFASVSGALYI